MMVDGKDSEPWKISDSIEPEAAVAVPAIKMDDHSNESEEVAQGVLYSRIFSVMVCTKKQVFLCYYRLT